MRYRRSAMAQVPRGVVELRPTLLLTGERARPQGCRVDCMHSCVCVGMVAVTAGLPCGVFDACASRAAGYLQHCDIAPLKSFAICERCRLGICTALEPQGRVAFDRQLRHYRWCGSHKVRRRRSRHKRQFSMLLVRSGGRTESANSPNFLRRTEGVAFCKVDSLLAESVCGRATPTNCECMPHPLGLSVGLGSCIL